MYLFEIIAQCSVYVLKSDRLLGACALAAAAAAFYAGTGGVLSAGPNLAKLLKGMAIIKTAILLASWRRHPVATGIGHPARFRRRYIIFGTTGMPRAALSATWLSSGSHLFSSTAGFSRFATTMGYGFVH
jgi:hypothetical protein